MTFHGDLPVAFILGTGRCGSSLLQEILARHPNVSFISNVDDRLARFGLRGRFNRLIYGAVPPDRTREGRLRFAPSEGYNILDREVSPILSRPMRDLTAEDVTPWLAKRLRRSIVKRQSTQDGTTFLHKFTGWPRAEFLADVFPGAKFIHVIRDGRAVANSMLQMPWWGGYQGPQNWRLGPLPQADQEAWNASGQSFVVLAGLYWRILMDAHASAEQSIPAGNWLNVRYEDLLDDPRDQVSELLQFMGLNWNDTFAGRFAKQPFHKNRVAAFEADLTPMQLEQLGAVIDATLHTYSYETHDGRAPADPAVGLPQ